MMKPIFLFVLLLSTPVFADNTSTGTNALLNNTTGTKNVAIGDSAMKSNTSGLNNTSVGYFGLRNNTSGKQNTAIGSYSLRYNTTGDDNTAVGFETLKYNTTGDKNTAVGNYALQDNTTGTSNTSIGNYALSDNTDGDKNTALGNYSMRSNASGNDNTSVGNYAMRDNTSGSDNTASGNYALRYNTTGSNNTALGNQSMKANTTGGFNTAIGDDAQLANTTGSYNVSNGNGTLNSANGDSNTAIGYRAGYTNATGSGNVMIGHKAGYNETGSNKLYISNGDTSSPLIHGDFSSGEVTINGNLTINTLKDTSGNSMIRTVGNVVHIGVNSVTLEDASTTSSGKDEIASSGNDLQIGTSVSHNTTVKGTLTVQTPSNDYHATTKVYVDNSVGTNTNNIQTNLDLININTSNIDKMINGLAQVSAMTGLTTAQNGMSHFSIAIGSYEGESAIAYGLSHSDDENNIMYKLQGSSSGNTSSSSLGVGFSF
jgi:hypothetical protein